MGLLDDILESLMEEGTALGPILMKVQYLASRIGSEPLEEWIKHETHGYPSEISVPDYRVVTVNYTGNFAGAFGATLSKAPIPSYLVKKYAGPAWVDFEIRDSIENIDQMLDRHAERGGFYVGNSSDLILMLQGKIFPDFTPISISGEIPLGGIVRIRSAVRGKLFQLAQELEKRVPAARELVGGSKKLSDKKLGQEVAANIVHNIVHGNVTTITNSGDGAAFTFNVTQGDRGSFVSALTNQGIPKEDADELADIVASERPEPGQPFGPKARDWLAANIGKAVTGAWKIGAGVAVGLITAAVKAYYNIGGPV